MLKRMMLLALMIFVLPVFAQGQSESVKINKLKEKTFTVNQLKITVTQLKDSSFFFQRPGIIQLEIATNSNTATTFNPHELSLVNRDNSQVTILGIATRTGNDKDYVSAEPITIAPGAHIKQFYTLTGDLHLPARLIYQNAELVSVTN